MYFQKKRVIAMLLAGGQGSRLKVLTEKTAPARAAPPPAGNTASSTFPCPTVSTPASTPWVF